MKDTLRPASKVFYVTVLLRGVHRPKGANDRISECVVVIAQDVVKSTEEPCSRHTEARTRDDPRRNTTDTNDDRGVDNSELREVVGPPGQLTLRGVRTDLVPPTTRVILEERRTLSHGPTVAGCHVEIVLDHVKSVVVVCMSRGRCWRHGDISGALRRHRTERQENARLATRLLHLGHRQRHVRIGKVRLHRPAGDRMRDRIAAARLTCSL